MEHTALLSRVIHALEFSAYLLGCMATIAVIAVGCDWIKLKWRGGKNERLPDN